MIYFIIAYFLFWFLYYRNEGAQDANVILWQQVTSDSNLTQDKRSLAEKYNKAWHTYDAYEKFFTHLLITVPIFFIGGTIPLYLALLLLSVSIRILTHDYFINKNMGINPSHIGTTDWFDIFLGKLQNKGISQWTIKFGLLVISIVLVILFL